MPKDIRRKWFFNDTPETVWDYLTRPELLSLWLMDNDFQPVVGHQFRFWSKPKENCSLDGVAICEVLEIVPNSRLSYSWKGGADGEMTVDSIVDWTLAQKANGTELQLHHHGFVTERDRELHEEGWIGLLGKLEQKLNSIPQ